MENKVDTGLLSLVLVANHYSVITSTDKLIQEFDIKQDLKPVGIVRIARDLGLFAKYKKRESITNIRRYQFPLICKMNNGDFVIAVDIDETNILVYDATINEHLNFPIEEFIELWTREIISIKLKKAILEDGKFSFAWFIKPILVYKRAITEVFVSIFIIQIFGIISPLIMQLIIDKVVVHNSINTLNVLGISLLVITIFEAILTLSKTYIFKNITSKVDILLGMKLFKQLVRLPLSYFESRRSGDTLSRIREVENVRSFITGGPLTSLLDVLFLFVYVIVMVYYSLPLTLIIMVSLVIYSILSLLVVPIFTNMLNRMYEKGADENSYLLEAINGMQTIKALALEGKKQIRWENILSDYIKTKLDLSLFNEAINQLSEFIRKFFDLLILYIGVRLVLKGNLTIGSLIAFRMLSGNVTGPVLKLVGMWQEFNQMKVSVEKIGDIFNNPTETKGGSTSMDEVYGYIRFENVSFKYAFDKPLVVRNMSFEIPQGKIIGIVGKSGSGKSTISKLVQRLYIPEAGSIYIDDYDISTVDPNSLRRSIGVVLQENFLFKGSIKENIEINKSNATMDDVIKSCKLAGAHDFIMDLPDKYDTVVGENGVGLSGGQRQRIAIARALIRNPRILIFDEATSALDYESESIINKNLKEICHDKTVLIIAHRLSTLKDADEIMVVEKGEIVEYDTHERLLEQKGIYHYLYSMQQRGE